MSKVPNAADGVGGSDPIEKIKNVLSSLESTGEAPTIVGNDDPAVLAADIALRAFGDCLTRAQAMALLPMWKGFRDLSLEQVHAVLDRFDGAL